MTNGKQQAAILVSLIPNLVEGHVLPYHLAIKEVTQILGWRHKVVYSGDANFKNLPAYWAGCLKGKGSILEADTNLIGNIGKITKVVSFAKSIANYLRSSIITEPGEKIIFIERFIHLQLLSLWLAVLFLPKNNLYIWILYRQDFHKSKTIFIYKLLNQLIKHSINQDNFKLLTDSELLSQSLCSCFQEPVTVMPIPHTDFVEKLHCSHHNYILCWWAGSPRAEKGWEIIKSMARYKFTEAEKFCLVAAKSSQLESITGGVQIKLIEDNLDRGEYAHWLSKSDLILLPYDSEAYSERTSGIFTESIIAGNIPVVTPHTWMAQELSKYNLEKLIIDWENNQVIFEQLKAILNDREILDKIRLMQSEYKKFHNVETYARKFQSFLNS
jgi:hypothetical protein